MLPCSCGIPIPSRPVYPAGWDGPGRDPDGIFKMGRDCPFAAPEPPLLDARVIRTAETA